MVAHILSMALGHSPLTDRAGTMVPTGCLVAGGAPCVAMIVLVASGGAVRQLLISKRTDMVAMHAMLQLAALPSPGMLPAHPWSLQPSSPCGLGTNNGYQIVVMIHWFSIPTYL